MARQLKRKTAIIAARHYPFRSGDAGAVRELKHVTVGEELAARVRAMASAYTEGDQTPPAAILWPDGDRRWAGVLTDLMASLPELYALGDFNPEDRTGPAIWLRCIEARTWPGSPEPDRIPIFYLPGISRQDLRAVEDCPPEREPLVELQFRGSLWSHPNGRDWTPLAFLSSAHGGLGLDVAGDADTVAALERALAAVLKERVADLIGDRLDGPYFNMLLAPDLPVALLRWMSDPEAARKRMSAAEWRAFCAQCTKDYRFHPEKDGTHHAAELLGNHDGAWGKVWQRFAEAPNRYPGVIAWLESAAPPVEGRLALDREYWPNHNAADEAALATALLNLKDKRADDATGVVLELEKAHGARRDWVWREVGRAPLAVALEPLSLLATLTRKPLAGPDATSMADQYVEHGWEADAAAMDALACATTAEANEAVAVAVRALYLPWLDDSARNLQRLAAQSPESLKPRLAPPAAEPGRVILFVDGLRLDLARHVDRLLQSQQLQTELAWDWAAFPSVTPTGKSAVSPMAALLTGGGAEAEFAPCIAVNGHRWTADRFHAFLKDRQIQLLQGRECGDPAGCAWAEAGKLDSRGHHEGAKTAQSLESEIEEIAGRIRDLLDAGWREIVVVTDHGWVLVPGGLPKVNLSHFLVEHRWGRCAAVKADSATDLPTLPWFWNAGVTIATPPGAGCFRAGLEYAHGGVSAQEMVAPRLTIQAGTATGGQAKLNAVKWVGLRCRVSVQHAPEGTAVDVRGRPADARSSKVEGGKPREIGADGTVSLPVGDDRELGNAAVVVLLASDGTVLHAVPTVVGGG